MKIKGNRLQEIVMTIGLSRIRSILVATAMLLLSVPVKASQSAPQASISISNLLGVALSVNMDECNGTACKPCHYCMQEGKKSLLHNALLKIPISADEASKNIRVYGYFWNAGNSTRIDCPAVRPSDNKRVTFKKKLLTRKLVCVVS